MRIVEQSNARSRKDIASWRSALQAAENIMRPRRILLYNLYDELTMDTHLAGLFDQRKLRVMGTRFRLVDAASGEEDTETTKRLDTPWFTELLGFLLDSVAWGHSLVELMSGDDGQLQSAELIPRRHVLPETGIVIKQQIDETGWPFREGADAAYLVEFGGKKDFGLMAKAAPLVLFKRNAMMAWSEYTEIFGMPMRVGKVVSRSDSDLDRMERMLQQMGSASYGIFQEGESIEFIESTKGDAFQVYNQLIDRCNKEMSKLVLGSTMVLDDGASLSQSEVHERATEEVIESDRRGIERVLNARLLPQLAQLGYLPAGLKFEWDRQEQIGIKDRWAMVSEAASLGFDLDMEIVRKTFGLPILLPGEKSPASNKPKSKPDDATVTE